MTLWRWMRKTLAEALPFVARSPEMQVGWLEAECRRGRLSDGELSPYIHLLLSGYASRQEAGEEQGQMRELFAQLARDVVVHMIRCTDIHDVPKLLELISDLTVEEAILVLRKEPPPYEKRHLFLLDQVFQAVNGCGEHLLERAGEQMRREGNAPAHFASAYERFKEILIDEKILAALYPQAKV